MAAPPRRPTTQRRAIPATHRPAPATRREPHRATDGRAVAAWLTGVLATLCVVGLIMVGSASSVISIAYYGSPWAIFLRECLWMIVGAAAFFLAARVDTRTVERMASLAMLATGVLLVAVLVPGLGTSSGGASRWIGIGPLDVQPSELSKLALCLFAAQVIARRERTEREWGKVLAPVAIATVVISMLVLVQPDMGTAAVLIAIAFCVVAAAGAPRRALVAGLGSLCALALVLAVALPYRRERLLCFLHPLSDPSGCGYQLLQSKIGLGTGHLFGLGLGNSREKWGLLPNPHTDFIFSIIGEELGIVGTTIVLVLLLALVFLCLKVAHSTPDRFSQLLAVGVAVWLATETIVNVGSVTGLLPITGIPLPFISFGGTSLVIDMAAIGLLAGIARRARERPPRLLVVDDGARSPRVRPPRPRPVPHAAPHARHRDRRHR